MAQAGTIGRQPGTIRTVDGPTIEYCLPSCTLCMMSDPGSDFRLYHSNSLDVLAALLQVALPAARRKGGGDYSEQQLFPGLQGN